MKKGVKARRCRHAKVRELRQMCHFIAYVTIVGLLLELVATENNVNETKLIMYNNWPTIVQ